MQNMFLFYIHMIHDCKLLSIRSFLIFRMVRHISFVGSFILLHPSRAFHHLTQLTQHLDTLVLHQLDHRCAPPSCGEGDEGTSLGHHSSHQCRVYLQFLSCQIACQWDPLLSMDLSRRWGLCLIDLHWQGYFYKIMCVIWNQIHICRSILHYISSAS